MKMKSTINIRWGKRKIILNILVCLGCHNKYHRLGVINNRNSFSHGSQDWKSKFKGCSRVGFWQSWFPWLEDGYLLAVSSQGLFSLCVNSGVFSSYKTSVQLD